MKGCRFAPRLPHIFRLRLLGTISGYRGNKVELLAQRPDEEIEYLTSGKVTPTSIEASFGQLGKVSLRFRPSGEVRRIRVGKRCAAVRPSVVEAQLGTFTGTVSFTGETRYTEVVPGRASGDPGARLSHKLRLECKASSEYANPTYSVSLIAGAARPPRGFLEFAASTAPLPAAPISGIGSYSFFAFVSEKTEGMSIFRTVSVLGPAGDFTFSSTLKSATVTPPFPFTGSASFKRNANGSATWRGTLAVPIPGLGVMPLVGPGIQSQLNEGVLVHQNEFQ